MIATAESKAPAGRKLAGIAFYEARIGRRFQSKRLGWSLLSSTHALQAMLFSILRQKDRVDYVRITVEMKCPTSFCLSKV
jgi:hypothetical protein